MKWKKINKDSKKQPQKGKYNDWKELIAQEGFNQCVYCAIHENLMGGIRNFHVEHYRPKSIFKELENDYLNLFYSCPICNTFKNNDWPNEPIVNNTIASYPNPSEVDYNDLFDIDSSRGFIEGKNVAAKYMQEKMFLNRPQLITQRRVSILCSRGEKEIEKTKQSLDKIRDDTQYRKYSRILIELMTELDKLKNKLREIPHYTTIDITKTT